MLATTAFSSTPLPVKGHYCLGPMEVSSEGIYFEDGSCVAAMPSKGPKVFLECEEPGNVTSTTTAILVEHDGVLDYSDDEEPDPLTLTKCE